MRILVTGSSGNIGSQVAAEISQEHTVIGLDIRPGRWTTALGSIEDREFLERLIPGLDGIVHCAAFLTPHVDNVPEERFHAVNVDGTENLLDLAIKHRVPRFVFTSTTSVYGCSTRKKEAAVWVTETLSPNSEDIYDMIKLLAETLCFEASKSGMVTAVMRMSRCFPEPRHLMAFYRLYRGVSGRDVAVAHKLGLGAEFGPFEIFNISAESPFLPDDCPALLRDPWPVIERYHPGSRAAFETNGWPLPQPIDRVYVIDKAKKRLGYNPQDTFSRLLNV